MDNNRLKKLHPRVFSDLVSLTDLSMWTNKITELDENLFQGLTKIETLDFGENKIERLPENLFKGLVSLQGVYFVLNPIKKLHKNLFKDLINLKSVWFFQATFETVPHEIFKNNGNLTSVRLGGKISKMSNKLFSPLKKLQKVRLRDNFCISVDIDKHNQSVLYTEDLLIPCSCEKSKVEKSGFLSKVFVFFGVIVGLVCLIIISMLCKCNPFKNLDPKSSLVTVKNGNLYLVVHQQNMVLKSIFFFLTVSRKTLDEYFNKASIHGMQYIVDKNSFLVTRQVLQQELSKLPFQTDNNS